MASKIKLEDCLVPMQKCWTCRKACGGCNWTAVDEKTKRVRFEPVKGWKAKRVRRGKTYEAKGRDYLNTYHIRDCPEYEPDPPRKSAIPSIPVYLEEEYGVD